MARNPLIQKIDAALADMFIHAGKTGDASTDKIYHASKSLQQALTKLNKTPMAERAELHEQLQEVLTKLEATNEKLSAEQDTARELMRALLTRMQAQKSYAQSIKTSKT